MPDAVPLAVKLPLPKLTLAIPESVTPPLRLIQPPAAAEIVPWQFVKSVTDPMPEKPCVAVTVRVVPTLCIMPWFV